MKKCFAVMISAFLISSALSFAGPDSSAIEAKEKAAWQAFKDKDEAGFKKVVDKDIRCVYDAGVWMMSDELAGMKDWDMKSFTISDYKIFSDEKDVVVATYVCKIDGTNKGNDASGTFNCGTVWKEEGGKWQAIFHTNIKQAPK